MTLRAKVALVKRVPAGAGVSYGHRYTTARETGLALGLYALNVQAGTTPSIGMMMAGALLMTLPVIGIFFFAQKYFIQGVTLTGMKG